MGVYILFRSLEERDKKKEPKKKIYTKKRLKIVVLSNERVTLIAKVCQDTDR